MITQLEIAIQSTYDTNTGSGPIASALNWECATRLNKVGAFSFEMPLADSKRSLLVAKRYVRCYGIVNDTWTEQGKPGIIEKIAKTIDGEGVPTGMIRVEGTDLFGELNDILIHELDIINTSTRIPDSVQYYDGTATAYLNMANAYDNNAGTSVEIPADDEDWHYIGDADPWDITTWDLGANLNDDHANFIVQYSQGAASWGSGTILSDTTKVDNASFGQDGAIRWERQEDWATDTVNSVANLYWLRFRYGEDMSGDVTVIEIDITQEIPTATALTLWQEYVDVDSNTPISTLGWDFEATHTETQNTVFLKLREVSAFKALAMIAEQTGENFRLGSGREIEWLQDDKTASGIVATNAIDATAGAGATTNCWITSFRQSSDAYELVGRVYPRGGGRGATRVNLLECTRTAAGGYTLSKALNYLQKDSVESDYGRPIERPKYWPELMSPNAANAKDINVANALYDLTYQYLQRHCIPQTAYDVEVVKLDSAVPVGTTLQVAYWQTVDGSAIMDVGVDGTPIHLWVLESTQRVNNKGLRSVAMKIATTDAWPTSAGAKMQEVVYQVLAIQATDGPMSAASLTVGSAADLVGSLDLSAYYKKPTDTRVILGLDAGNVPPGNYNCVLVGKEAGLVLTSGADNTFVGYRSGYTTTTGYDNVAIGADAFRLGKSTGNVAIGYQALEDAGTTSDGDSNTAVGHSALMNMDTGDDNVAIGAYAMWISTAGDRNIAIGEEAMHDGIGNDNIAIGHHCMTETGAASQYNIGIGENAMVYNGAGDSNIGIGHQALLYNDDGNNNVAVGEQAGYGAAASGGEAYSNNVLIGYQAGYGLDVGGDDNVMLGYQAGLALTTGSLNVFIGKLAGSQETTGANKLYIENSNSATPLIYGEFDNDLVKIHGDLCLGTEDGGGRLNFDEGTTIADGIVWGSDANKVTLYRSADDMLKTDDSLTVALGLNVGTATGATVAGRIDAEDTAINTAVGFTGIRGTYTKTAGVTDAVDDFFASLFTMIMNDADSTIGHLVGFGGVARLTSGTIGAGKEARGVYAVADIDAGTVTADIIGARIDVDIEAGVTSIGGNVYGLKIWVDADKDPTGTVSMIYLDEASNVDYGIYQNGTATNYFGGNTGIGQAPGASALMVYDDLAGDYAFAVWNDGDNANRHGIAVTAGADDASGVTVYLGGWDGDGGAVGQLANNNGTFEVIDQSDERLKRDISPTADVLDRLRQVEVLDWTFKRNGTRHTGFVAQRLEKQFPQCVIYNELQDLYGTARMQMIPVSVKAIQELDSYRLDADAEREAIRAEIAGLQEKLDEMERRG